ncbi:hypothetical protein OA958_01040 [Bacteroidota bacterium]|nr:hypothetical protein [Bacteroidota bacterium]
MKNLITYILLALIFTNCSSGKIISKKVNNKKWDINYLNNNNIEEPQINNSKNEILNVIHNESNDLFEESEKLLASNDDLIEDKRHEISPINKINNKQKLFSESPPVLLKSNQTENIVTKQISKIDNTKKTKFLKKNKKADDNLQIERLSRTSIHLNLAALGILTFGFIFYIPFLVELSLVVFFCASIVNLLTLLKIKKRKQKIRNQRSNTKRNIWISTFISIVEFLAATALLIWALTFSVGGYGGPW